jgi:hypothetical protein
MEAGAKCDSTGPSTVCRNYAEALEREYQGGKLKRIRVHRRGRLAPASFGVGPQRFQPPRYRLDFEAPLGRPIVGILGKLGPPLKKAQASDPDFGTIMRYSFSGLDLEVENVDGHDVVGALVVLERHQ